MSFDWLAPHYRWLEAVLAGGVLQRARTAHFQELDGARHVLIAGAGPGRCLEELRRRWPTLTVTVLDQSAAMLAVARRHSPHGPTTFFQADLQVWVPPRARFDVIVTPCVLDCFSADALPHVIDRLAMAATNDASWLLTDFTIPPRGWRRVRAQIIHRLMYTSFRLATSLPAHRLTPPDPWLQRAGFVLVARRHFNAGLIHADHWRRR